MIEIEKMHVSTTNNLHNLGALWIIDIFLILLNVYVVPRDQNKIVIYINNYINWDQFNQVYDLDWIEKNT